MTRVRVHNFAMSLDGFCAGPDQGPETPLGVGGQRLHEWVFETAAGRRMIGEDGGADGVDSDFIDAGFDGIGATVMGRNMFGPVRGPWPDDSWQGWWGDVPPYHHEVFVLTHHPRASFEMEGGTTFHFVTDGPDAALDRAVESAAGADVRVGGGVATVQAYLRSGRIDLLHVPVVPVVLGAGERLFEGMAEAMAAYECREVVATAVAHLTFLKR
jgi:dihydrofolate reductase